jgi:hypothetical protein
MGCYNGGDIVNIIGNGKAIAKPKTIDHYIHLLQEGKFKKASKLQPCVDQHKQIWNRYLKQWREYALPIL